MLALSWVLIVSHCRIASVDGFGFLKCATAVHEAGPEGDDHGPCEDGEHCSFETLQFHLLRQGGTAVLVPTELEPFEPLRPPRSEPVEFRLVVAVKRAAEQETRSSPWQFAVRAASPPRAPSVFC